MSNDTASKNRPTHRLYSVTKDGKGETVWDELGALWPHKDGNGFSLKLAKTPVAGAHLVIRKANGKKGGAQ